MNRWAAAAVAAMVTAAGAARAADAQGVSAMLPEESPDVFLAKATLQQYLSRVVRKDWEGARRLTHPKTLSSIAQLRERTGRETHNLAPWADSSVQLKTFRFVDARPIGPGVVLVEVSEDTYRAEEQGMSEGDPAVYILFHTAGRFLVGDKKAGQSLADVNDEAVRIGYPGFAGDRPQARRATARR